MTSISKNLYIDQLHDVINEYNNTYYTRIKMRLIDVKSSMYIDFSVKNNDQNPQFEVDDHVEISKYKNIFVKVYTPT